MMKKLNLYKIRLNEEVVITPLRLVNGKYGMQIIGLIKDTEYFLPRNTQLINKILNIGLNKTIHVKKLTIGSKKEAAEFQVTEVTTQQKLL